VSGGKTSGASLGGLSGVDHQRRAPRAGGRDRRHPAALHLRPIRRRIRCGPIRSGTDALADKLPKVAEHLDAARAELLAFTGFPKQMWRQIWFQQPLSGSTKRSAGAPTSSGSSPDRTAIIRLVGAVLAEQHDEWIKGRRYLGLDVLTRSRAVLTTPDEPATPQPTTTSALTA
jgi:transposase-like protein